MYRMDVDRQHAVIDLVLDGLIRQEEMVRLGEELKSIIRKFSGRSIKLKTDMRTLRASSPEVAEMFGAVQRYAVEHGVKRMAELVTSPLLLLQLNRVERDSGAAKIVRRFGDDQTALRWLLQQDDRAALAV